MRLGEHAFAARKGMDVYSSAVVCGLDKLQWHLVTTSEANHLRGDHARTSPCEHRSPPALTPESARSALTISDYDETPPSPF
jgi:hypothetical protein